MSGCTGHCCRSFMLGQPALEVLTSPTDSAQDGDQVRDMVIVKEWCETEGGEIYARCACRHFDADTGRCGIYEDRPRMCSRHGVDYPCDTPSCTLAESEKFKEPQTETVT